MTTLLLLGWICLPALLTTILAQDSLAPGLLASAAGLAGLTVVHRQLRGEKWLDLVANKAFYLFFGAALASLLLSLWVVDGKFEKQVNSICGLAVLLVAGNVVLDGIFRSPAGAPDRAVSGAYYALVLIGLVGILAPLRFGHYAPLHRPVAPFPEPSHYALAYAQLAAMMMAVARQRARWGVVLTSFAFALLLPSTTLLAVSLLLVLIVASGRGLVAFLLLFGGVAVAVGSFFPELLEYFSSRLYGDAREENISYLVYVQGWESLDSAIRFTSGLGVGFQNLGIQPAGESTNLLNSRALEGLNREDGGFLLAKIGGEFGLLGVVASAWLIVVAIASGAVARRTIRAETEGHALRDLVPYLSAYVFLIELLVRGLGYFSPTFVLTLYLLNYAADAPRQRGSLPGEAPARDGLAA